MNINPINRTKNISMKSIGGIEISPELPVVEDKDLIIKELERMSSINNVNITKKDYELNLTMEELQKRTHKDYLTTKKMLAVEAPEYTELADGDKQALKHLVKAAIVLDKINMQLDNPHNLPFKEYLEKEIAKAGIDTDKVSPKLLPDYTKKR